MLSMSGALLAVASRRLAGMVRWNVRSITFYASEWLTMGQGRVNTVVVHRAVILMGCPVDNEWLRLLLLLLLCSMDTSK